MSEPRRRDEIQGDIVHEYDGIEEADNALPRWWLTIFFLTVIFSIGYWFYYHELEIEPLPRAKLAAELATLKAAQATAPEVSEGVLLALSLDAPAVAEGRAIYEKFCMVCHDVRGQGKIGPNLTDHFWIHGGSPTQIFDVVSKGVLTAGMPAWEGPLGADGVEKAVAYVLTLRDTNVPGKEPQGSPWPAEPGAAPSAAPNAPAARDAGG